ncbi:MAG TPA: hypothetical protein VKY74_05905 [Chloroflexia bacterium]|nr:hypothetical protein [Chloroflexia bacterium]
MHTPIATPEPLAAPAAPAGSGLSAAPDALRALVAGEEQRREIIREFIARNLKSGTDYGTVLSNGRESKPSLFKPGAEKICLLFQLRPKFLADAPTLAMAGNPAGLFAYICRLFDPQGHIVGEGRGAAELTERAGWTANNAIKIAEKRAQVDAVLRTAGLSEIFTQDLEDLEQRQALDKEPRPAPEKEPAPRVVGYANGHGEPPRTIQEAPPAARPPYGAEGGPAPAPVARPSAPLPAAGDADDLCTEQQQRTIRGLLPRAGIAEAELVRKLGVPSVADLPRAKAAKVIDRLTANARERSQKAAG